MVVLIIGILAAVALPQYQKAVRKARLAEVATTVAVASQALDMWVLEQGYPEEDDVQFVGSDKTTELSNVTLNCSTESEEGSCNTKVGTWHVWCLPDSCNIRLDTFNYADGTYGNSWLDEAQILWKKAANSQWILTDPGLGKFSSEICLWWSRSHGTNRVGTGCADYL